MTGFPEVIISTDRATLRAFRGSDIEELTLAGADDITQTWLPLPQPYTRARAEAWCGSVASEIRMSGRGLVLGIDVDGRCAGSIDFKRTDWLAGVSEIGYLSCPWARGQGFMTEAVHALAVWGLTDIGLHRVELRIAAENQASLRVAEKAGFHREGVARAAGYVHGGRVDLVILSLIRADLGSRL